MTKTDSYNVLAERLGYPGSVRLRRVLKKLMPPEEAEIAILLPATTLEISLSSWGLVRKT